MNLPRIETQLQAHSDTARHEARRHMKNARDAVKAGDDDNAFANVLDAMRLLGRAQAFADMAGELLEYLGEDEES